MRMDRKLMTRQHKTGIIAALFFLAGFLSLVDAGFAEEAEPVGTVRQMEATIVHVDQYAVYAPNLVFYFDTRMEKRKIESMMRAADRLRNKKAMITCFSDADKHALLLDIGPAEKSGSGKPPREAPGQTADAQEKPGLELPGEEVPSIDEEAPTDIESSEPQGYLKQDVAPEKKPPRPGELAAITGQQKPGGKLPTDQVASTDTKSSEPQGYLKQDVAPEKKPPRPGELAAITGQQKPGGKLPTDQVASTDTKSSEPQGYLKQNVAPEKKLARPREPAPITGDEVTRFIRELLELNERKDLSAITPFYADNVDYYDRGLVSRDDVRKDMGYYFRNWDIIATSLDGDVIVTPADQPEIRIARFISSFSVRNKKKALTGRTENNWKVQRIDGKLRLIDVKQRIISKESSVVQ